MDIRRLLKKTEAKKAKGKLDGKKGWIIQIKRLKKNKEDDDQPIMLIDLSKIPLEYKLKPPTTLKPFHQQQINFQKLSLSMSKSTTNKNPSPYSLQQHHFISIGQSSPISHRSPSPFKLHNKKQKKVLSWRLFLAWMRLEEWIQENKKKKSEMIKAEPKNCQGHKRKGRSWIDEVCRGRLSEEETKRRKIIDEMNEIQQELSFFDYETCIWIIGLRRKMRSV